ncbi:MAG: DUF2200 family protein [Coriobacteriales bacterium]
MPYWKWLEDAPKFNAAALKVKGKACGISVAEVKDPTMCRMHILDKLVDDLAKGKRVCEADGFATRKRRNAK